MFRRAISLTFALSLLAFTASAAENGKESGPSSAGAPAADASAGAAATGTTGAAGTSGTAAAPSVGAGAETPVSFSRLAREPRRPGALSALYGTYAALQVMDFVTTQKAIHSGGATEVNPVMGGGRAVPMMAVKAIGGAASLYFAERTWKKNRVGAIVMMAAINSATAIIVANNASHIRR